METPSIPTSPISNLFNLPGAAGPQAPADGGLGRDEFLELLTTQLRFQDPLNPISNQEFAAQLAQFASLEQMQQMNASLRSELLIGQSLNNAMAAGMIGRTVRVASDQFAIPAAPAGGDPGAVVLPRLYVDSAAGDATVAIQDATGRTVRTLHVAAGGSGPTEVVWDGRDDEGAELPPGAYRFAVTVLEGAAAVPTYVEARVDRVRFDDGATQILMGDLAYTLADVVEIQGP